MSDERVRREFEELQRQARHANPEPGLARLQMSSPSRRNIPGWTRALGAAAVVIVAVGIVAFANRGPGEGGEVAAGTDQSTATTVALVGAPGEPQESAGLAAGTTTTSLVSTDDSTVPTQPPTATTIDPVENRRPVFAGEGWRVVGVAADDVLNVRTTPDATGEIVGTYAPDSELVRLNGQGSTDTDGQGWWGVTLPDGTDGFVNRTFLEPPLSWVADVPADMCGLEETPDFGQDGDEVVDLEDQPNTVLGMARIEGEGCDRFVIVLGNTDFETGAVAPVASFSAVGTELLALDDGVKVALPSGLTEVVQTATIDRFGAILAVVATAVPPAQEGFGLRLLADYEDATLSFRANPARIIVDLVGTDDVADPTWITGDGLMLLAGPLVIGGENAQVEINGFARWFEGAAFVVVRDDRGPRFPADFGGASFVSDSDVGVAILNASWLPTYGAFQVFVDGLVPGNYQISIIESECAEFDGTTNLDACGLETTFTIP